MATGDLYFITPCNCGGGLRPVDMHFGESFQDGDTVRTPIVTRFEETPHAPWCRMLTHSVVCRAESASPRKKE